MAVTQRDIAKRLNLSQSTVAKVLNNSPDVWVSEANRERILGLARELNYRPNKRFGRYSAVTCAYVIPPSHNVRLAYNFAIEILAERLIEIGFELKVKIFPDERSVLEHLSTVGRAKDTAACVLFGREDAVETQGLLLEREGIPFVTKGRFEKTHPHWNQVDFHHEKMMRDAVKHLVDRGHRRIAYMGQQDPECFVALLFEGYREGMCEFGLDVDDRLVASGESTLEYGLNTMSRWLELPAGERPTAIAIGTGSKPWHGIEKALFRKGLRLGGGIGEIGIAGTSVGELTLALGHGYAYRDLMLEELTAAMFDHLLLPILQDLTIVNPIVRLEPSLLPVDSLDLLN